MVTIIRNLIIVSNILELLCDQFKLVDIMLELFIFVEKNVAKVDCELSNCGLKSAGKNVIFNDALQGGAELPVDWQSNETFQNCVQSWICSGWPRIRLFILDEFSICLSRKQRLEIKMYSGFLDW